MRILEELWYGNIEPTEYDTCPCAEYKKALQLISRNEEKLQATMTAVCGQCTGVPRYGRVSAVSEQLPPGCQDDTGYYGRMKIIDRRYRCSDGRQFYEAALRPLFA